VENVLAYTATEDVREALASLGRTEDVTFTPDGRRLVIAAYGKGVCLFVDVALDFSAGRRRIVLSDTVEISSPDIREPHGIAFLDAETMLVANRATGVRAFKVPARLSEGGRRSLDVEREPIAGDAGMHVLPSPGSVAVIPKGGRRYDLIVCRNYSKRVTHHRLEAGAGLRVTKSKVLLRWGLDVPDGVAASPSGRWIAVSNHHAHTVMMFRNTWLLGKKSRPAGELRATTYPHGLRFTPDGRYVLVADAGNPFVNVYAAAEDDWRGPREPIATVRVLDDAAFLRGQGGADPEEGGPKGIDIDPGMNVLAMTNGSVPLAFFDLSAILPRA
jgi:DNA-binding beta-propeller fold protein YncE